MSYQTELRQQITEKIVAAIRAGTPPWRRPWGTGSGCSVATNITTRKRYRGINPLLLQIAAQEYGFVSNWWGTFRQWQTVGGWVQKRPDSVAPGAWGTKVVFYCPIERVIENEDGEEEEEKFFVLRQFTVFNLDQVDGEALDHLRQQPATNGSPIVDYKPAEEAIQATQADIRYGGDQAFYDRLGDYIQMPPKETFSQAHEWYGTHFHELVHWSECRLNWKGCYALGELIAEIGSCYLANELAIPQSDDLRNHNAYLAHWLKALEDDHNAIFRASNQASKAADFILSFSRKPEEKTSAGAKGGVAVGAA